jgi:glycyl-tRNA synthetase beta subunit
MRFLVVNMQVLLRAAELAYADQTTLMVREYPNLAGIYGAILLRHEDQEE